MRKHVYGFDNPEDLVAARTLAQSLGRTNKSGQSFGSFQSKGFEVSYGEVTTKVTAASGNDLGTGEVKIYNWDVEDATPSKSVPAAAQAITVWNPVESKFLVGDDVLVLKAYGSFILLPYGKDGTLVYATCDSAITATVADNTCTVTADSPNEEATDKVEIENPGFFTASAGKTVVGCWSNGRYRIVNVEC